ncbi:MAG: phosphoglucosamine mutase [Candidatus Micrarchaeota archaeon]
MFGTSGIRGIANVEVTPELALRVGSALVEKAGEIIFVARDTRTSGEMLENALCSGIASAGGEAVRLGIAPTPTLALATRNHASKGVMLTASHNPPEYNGIKIFDTQGEISRSEEEKIAKKVREEKFTRASWQNFRPTSSYSSAIREHLDLVLSLVDIDLISRKKPKVLIDAGNAAGSVITPFALREAGCKVISANCEPSGFFARGLEPNADNLSSTSALTRATRADLAIAHDGDADRAIILDEKGELLGLDSQLALACEEILAKKKGAIVTTVEASLAVRESIENSKGKFIQTPVGSLFVAQEMRKSKALFGGEPCGEYIYPEGVFVPDGILAALKYVELFCEKGKLSALKQKIKVYPMKRAKYPCSNKARAMENISKEARVVFKGKLNDSDGVRVDFEDSWLLMRASGTEPILRITCEAKTQSALDALFAKAEALVKKHSKN